MQKEKILTEILKKIKLNLTLMFSAAVLFALFSVLTALTAPNVSSHILRETSKQLKNSPKNHTGELSDVKYALQRTYSTGSIFRSISVRRNFNPVPPAFRTQDLVCLPLSEQLACPVKKYFFKGERFIFQNYLQSSLPLRAGPYSI